MIQVSHVFHDYEGKGKFAVSDISFSVEGGSIFGFLGPSGAGKSTIQNIMTGLLPIQQGEVLYDGTSVRGLNAGFFNQIGVSFEQSNLMAELLDDGLIAMDLFAHRGDLLPERVDLRQQLRSECTQLLRRHLIDIGHGNHAVDFTKAGLLSQ